MSPMSFRPALLPVLETIATLSAKIRELDQKIDAMTRDTYPDSSLLTGGGECGQPHGACLCPYAGRSQPFPGGLGWLVPISAFVPGRKTFGDKQSQLRITKAGDELLRSLLVECAHHMIGPLGADSDLRRWGLKLAERGGKNAKKRAVVAVARKLLCSSSPPVGDR